MRLDALRCHVPHEVVRTFDEMQRLWQRHPERAWFADRLGEMLGTRPAWEFPGLCGACEVPVVFEGRTDVGIPEAIGAPYLPGAGTVPLPNFRESVLCPRCQLNTRQRLAAELVRDLIRQPTSSPDGRRGIYLHEQVTAMYRWVTSSFSAVADVVGSEYLGDEHAGGAEVNGIRHEDIHHLSFDDEQFDVVLSTDVLEHIWDVDQVMRETVRVLRPGGTLVATVPWNYGAPHTIQTASKGPAGIEYHDRPEIHGNPTVPDEGSLVFYRYGWDLLDRIRSAGFDDVAALAFWSSLHGVIGERCQWVLVATRAGH